MAMTTYWDLSEQERAALTADDVQRYVDAELMLKGVLKVKPLEIEPEPNMPVPVTKAFVVRFASKYGSMDSGVAFATLDAAQAFVALRPMNLASEYLESTSVPYTKPAIDSEIAEVPIFTEEAKNAVRADLKRGAAIKASNGKRREEYTKAVAAQESALSGLWEDWTTCREEEAKLRAVADTLKDYQRTAGDDGIALSFLAKVYPAALIEEAAKRFGFPVTAPTSTPNSTFKGAGSAFGEV